MNCIFYHIKAIKLNRIKRSSFVLIILLFSILKSFSQDLHFTQYNNSPLLVNPANTGFSHFYDYRIGLNNRTQWAGTNVPYKTYSVWGDAQIFKQKFENSWIGVGGILLNDVAGSGSLTSIKAFGSLAYHQFLNDKNILSVGVSGGLVQKRVDFSKLTFDNQWNNIFFDIDAPNGENIISSQQSYVDLNLGINYSLYASDNFYFNTGFSLMHFNNPKESFFSTSVISPNIATRYNAFLNASVRVNDVLILSPLAFYSKRLNIEQLLLGFNGQYNLSGEGGNIQLLFGGYFRSKDAIAPSIGFQVGDIQFMYNYDATTSSLATYSQFKNASEISITWNSLYPSSNASEKAVRCKGLRF